MPHVVTDACIKCKFTECVSVCPVDCFHEGESMLVINLDECIDCAACVSECPVNAIEPEDDTNTKWLEINQEFSEKWPKLTMKKEADADADNFKDMKDKYPQHFSPKGPQ